MGSYTQTEGEKEERMKVGDAKFTFKRLKSKKVSDLKHVSSKE